MEPGVWFRLALGGITGHRDLARDTGIVVRRLRRDEVADAIVRVFIREGDRTNRTKARLKYVLDAWGFEKFLAAVEAELGAPLARVDAAHVLPRPRQDRQAHIGVHPQKQPGLHWIGVVLPVGRLTVAQMRGLAALARDLGDGDIRLTVWQNLLISGVPADSDRRRQGRIEALGLDWQATSIRAGLVACTGSTGCKFAAADTKGHAEDIARWCEERVTLDSPVNIHLTGCHHSCAQHYIGDIGLIGAKVPVNEEGDTVEGYHLVSAAASAPRQASGANWPGTSGPRMRPRRSSGCSKPISSHRSGPDETFQAFTRRHDIEALQALNGELAE